MIVVSLGANLGHAQGTARDTLEAAVKALDGGQVSITARSRWYRSAPVPPSRQPDYINGAALLETVLDPWELLALMHRIEARFGRRRARRWGARTLDLDLVDYHGFITLNGWRGGRLCLRRFPSALRASKDRGCGGQAGFFRPGELCLPHPRAHERAFVLCPLAEIAPRWRHPVFGSGTAALLRGPAASQRCEPLEDNRTG